MDMEKLKQWMELAQNMHGGEFWNNIFDAEFAKQFLNEKPINTSAPTEQEDPNLIRKTKDARTFPFIEILEGTQEVYIIIDLPGAKKEDIELGIAENVLTLKGRVLPFYPQLKRTYSERFSGEFQRKIKLPDPVPPHKLKAKFWNGLLFVSYTRAFTKVEIMD